MSDGGHRCQTSGAPIDYVEWRHLPIKIFAAAHFDPVVSRVLKVGVRSLKQLALEVELVDKHDDSEISHRNWHSRVFARRYLLELTL